MTYSISIGGHTDKKSKQEVAEAGRTFAKTLDGVTTASLNWSSGGDRETIDLTKPAGAGGEERNPQAGGDQRNPQEK